jgi:hypothetical protein
VCGTAGAVLLKYTKSLPAAAPSVEVKLARRVEILLHTADEPLIDIAGAGALQSSLAQSTDFEHLHYLPPQDSLKRRTSITSEIL